MEKISVKWGAQSLEVQWVEEVRTVGDLKRRLEAETGVPLASMKLLGLRTKDGKKPATEGTALADLDIKVGTRIMMTGQPAKVVEEVNQKPEGVEAPPDDDLDGEEPLIPFQQREEYLAKIQRRITSYKIEIMNPPRLGKKLLVLDIDYTIYDHKSSAERIVELVRPNLFDFLQAVYPFYDIVIWSATSMKWIKAKLNEIGLVGREEFKIAFCLDCDAMISVYAEKQGLIEVKPLGLIWGKFPENFSKENTIMFDDVRRNFLMNPDNGLRIRSFRDCHLTRAQDRELLLLKDYLLAIASEPDFTALDHSRWEKHKSGRHRKKGEPTSKEPRLQ